MCTWERECNLKITSASKTYKLCTLLVCRNPKPQYARLSKLRDTWRPSLQSTTSADRASSARQQICFSERKETQLSPRTTTHKRKDRTSSFVTRLNIVSTATSISMQTPTYKASSPTSSYVVRKITPPSSLQHRNPATKAHIELVKFPQEARRITV